MHSAAPPAPAFTDYRRDYCTQRRDERSRASRHPAARATTCIVRHARVSLKDNAAAGNLRRLQLGRHTRHRLPYSFCLSCPLQQRAAVFYHLTTYCHRSVMPAKARHTRQSGSGREETGKCGLRRALFRKSGGGRGEVGERVTDSEGD